MLHLCISIYIRLFYRWPIWFRVIVIVRKWLELIVATLFDYGIADWKSTISQIVLACDHFSLLYALSPQVNIGVALGARQDQICLLKLWFWCIVKIWYHIYIKCVRFASWSLPKLLTSLLRGFLVCMPTLGIVLLYVYGACYSKVVWQKWRGLLGIV